MDEIIYELLELIKQSKPIDNHTINRVIRKCTDASPDNNRKFSKKKLVPYYLKRGAKHFGLDNPSGKELEKRLLAAIQIKPRRTASGVATITVMTKPWACQSTCIYCPNDLRMPKSYLSDEPVCQRAEYAYFDPYLQVISRLRALKQMGHPTDKIELIILGGTFCDYPKAYQIWYVSELFRALNDSEFMVDTDFEDVLENDNPFKVINNSPVAEGYAKTRIKFYEELGLNNQRANIRKQMSGLQSQVDNNQMTYNEAIAQFYGKSTQWQKMAKMQTKTLEELEILQQANETSKHRVVGLVIETRPDTITTESLTLIRKLGCTKVQMGIQSLQEDVLQKNHRNITVDKIAEAHSLLRLFGFKIHIHFMVNLLGSNSEKDKADYLKLVQDERFLPDEVKLYPCMLVNGTELTQRYKTGEWQPYDEETLVDILAYDTLITPRYTRISRMIRDISAHDIMAGNKKSNLRQVVENTIEDNRKTKASSGSVLEIGQNTAGSNTQAQPQNQVLEIRYREISTSDIDTTSLDMKVTPYDTAVAKEYFLEWVTPEDKIAGFLRLSLSEKQAMIREVHIYGKVANLDKASNTSHNQGQHQGLGKKLIGKACEIALENGYDKIRVISAVGTREYYRALDFADEELYQVKALRAPQSELAHMKEPAEKETAKKVAQPTNEVRQ